MNVNPTKGTSGREGGRGRGREGGREGEKKRGREGRRANRWAKERNKGIETRRRLRKRYLNI